MIIINDELKLNLQEQVLKNQQDIASIITGAIALGEMGIHVVGQTEDPINLPDPAIYLGTYGDAYLVGDEAPYDYYIFTRPFPGELSAKWFNLGKFPVAGPKGPQGELGPTPNIRIGTVNTTAPHTAASITITGTAAEPILNFSLPRGDGGERGPMGPEGRTGPAGTPGRTPVRGTDYWTAADRQAIINDILAAYPPFDAQTF